MALPFNTTGEAAVVIEALTNNITGDVFLSLFAIIVVVLALAMAARIPIEWTGLVVYPVILALVAITNDFLPVLGILIFYTSILLAKNFIYK